MTAAPTSEQPIVDAEIVADSVDAPEPTTVDPAGIEDTIADDFGTPDIDDATRAAAGEREPASRRTAVRAAARPAVTPARCRPRSTSPRW